MEISTAIAITHLHKSIGIINYLLLETLAPERDKKLSDHL
jgi:hypothetical protein